LVGLKEEGHTIANKTHHEETVYVKKVCALFVNLNRADQDWLRWWFQDP
jgi:hypothetical protein